VRWLRQGRTQHFTQSEPGAGIGTADLHNVPVVVTELEYAEVASKPVYLQRS
tara:strand:- start:3458 stop:3613 length:156 start_codon:yes stop_codon:yes gene_type:complete